MAFQYSAILILRYNGHITVAHMIMLNAINSNRRTTHIWPLHMDNSISGGVQNARNMTSLPPEFALAFVHGMCVAGPCEPCTSGRAAVYISQSTLEP